MLPMIFIGITMFRVLDWSDEFSFNQRLCRLISCFLERAISMATHRKWKKIARTKLYERCYYLLSLFIQSLLTNILFFTIDKSFLCQEKFINVKKHTSKILTSVCPIDTPTHLLCLFLIVWKCKMYLSLRLYS